MVHEHETTLAGAAGPAETVVFRHDDGARPGVLMYTDIGGIRASQKRMARSLAEAGYTVVMPNVFYRTRALPIFDFELKFGEERTTKRLAELRAPLDAEAIDADARAWCAGVAGLEGVEPGPIGVVGYCFTGAYALRTAAARPDRVAAAASFHGGRLVTDGDDSPHRALPRVTARLYFGHAENDSSMPAADISTLDAALADWGGEFTSVVYEGARHGWTVPDAPSYREDAARSAFAALTGLFGGAALGAR